MAELRIIQSNKVEDIAALHPLLALSDQFNLIPRALSSLKLVSPAEDPHILIVGPTGLYYLSYRLLEQVPIHYLEAARCLGNSASILNRVLVEGHVSFPLQLFLIVEDGNVEASATEQVMFIPEGYLIERIQNQPRLLSEDKIEMILEILKAQKTFGRVFCYQILSELGKRHNEVDYLAIDTINEQLVRLKELNIPYNPEHLERNSLVRGAKLTQDLRHENILSIEKLIPQEDKVFIVSEWCEGSITLRQYLDNLNEPVPLTIAIQMIKDLCQALIYAHNRGIIHRNLSPDNLLITPDHRLKVTNFDSAKRTGIQTLQTNDLRRLTRQNPYAAPEYLVGAFEIDQRVDVYAVGIIFYELLTGHHPQHYNEELWEPPSLTIQAIPPYMDKLIAKTIRFDRDQRYSTVQAFVDALDRGVKDKLCKRYRILEDIGINQSETYIIYKALDTENNELVGLQKCLIPSILNQTERRQLFEQLSKKTQQLMKTQSSGVLPIYDFFIEDQDFYVVLAWGDYHPLSHILDDKTREPMMENDIKAFLSQLIPVAECSHKQQMATFFHPDYLFILPNQQFSYLMSSIFLFEDVFAQSTRIRYLAPEQLNNLQSLSFQASLFTIGFLAFQLSTHHSPYELSYQKGYFGQEIRAIQAYRSDFNPEFEACILKLLNQDPIKRSIDFCLLSQEPEPSNYPEVSEVSVQFAMNWTLVGGSLSWLGLCAYILVYWWTSGEAIPVIQEVYYE